MSLRQGIGSTMHLATIHLATAMQYDRILLWAPNMTRTPIPEDSKWWERFSDPDLQTKWDAVRLCLGLPRGLSVPAARSNSRRGRKLGLEVGQR